MVKKKGLPEWGKFVLCRIKRVTPYAAWCILEEYPNVDGMIHISEVAGKWVHDIRDFVKEGKRYVAKVVKIDYQKNFVNLSLKRVTKRDEKEKLNAFRREKRGEKMLEHAGKELGKNLDQTYEEVGFILQEKFGELFSVFEVASSSPDDLLKEGIAKEWVDAIKKVAKKSFKKKEIVIKAELELKSFASDGIERIKKALNDLAKRTGAEVKYISAPIYRVSLKTIDPKTDEKMLKEGLEETIKQLKMEGSYKLIK